MTTILQLVTDFSFASGDHIYIAQLLSHLRKVHGDQCSLHVAELAGHGGGPNRFIYGAMADLDVTVHQLSSYEGGNLDFAVPAKVGELLRSLRPDIVHSHHFFTDLCALICRTGNARYLRELGQLEHARFLPQLVELIEHLGKDRLFSALLQDILPLRTWETSSVLEPVAFRWLSTKHATEPLSIANRSAIDGLYQSGTLVHSVVTELNTDLQRLVSGAVDQVVTINAAAQNAWNQIGITSETINVAAVGDAERQLIQAARAERDTIRQLFNVGEGGNLFLFASRMSKKKQPVAFVRAFLEHVERWPLDRLVMAGEGSETQTTDCR